MSRPSEKRDGADAADRSEVREDSDAPPRRPASVAVRRRVRRLVAAARKADRDASWGSGMSTRVAQGELTELPVLLSVVCYTQPVHSGCFSMGLTWSVRATRPRSQRGATGSVILTGHC